MRKKLDRTGVIERVKPGDLTSFELIMRRYNRRLFCVSRSLAGNAGEAEEIGQEAYVRAYKKQEQFEGRARPIV